MDLFKFWLGLIYLVLGFFHVDLTITSDVHCEKSPEVPTSATIVTPQLKHPNKYHQSPLTTPGPRDSEISHACFLSGQ